MKRFIVLLSLVATVVVSCSIKEESPAVTEGGHHITLSGESYTATKVSIGEKDGDVYPLLWFTGDAISIYSTDGTWSGEIAGLYSTSVGSVSGIFQTSNELNPETDMDLVILYPGGTLSYSDGVVSGSVSSSQTQRSANSSIHVGSNCVSYAETSINAGQTEGVKFALNQKTAFVKVIVKMDEYSGYELSSVSLAADGFDLTGSVSYNIETGEMTVRNGSSSVRATISNTSLLTEEQDVYFTCLPCDLRGSDVYVTATLVSDTQTVTVPVPMKGGLLKEGCLSIIEISEGTMLNWYDPIETRDLLDAWAYGKQNTYMVERYEDAVNTINIDVRARGEFSQVKEPKYYGLLTGSSNRKNQKFCYLPDGTEVYQEVPTNKVKEDCTIDVNIYSQKDGEAQWANVAIYDEDYNILWSFMIWGYLPGDELGDITYSSDIVLLDRDLGAPYSHGVALELGTFGAPYAYFQWGRKDAFPWGSDANYPTNYNVLTPDSSFDFVTAIEHPTSIFNNQGTGWLNGRTDFWGGENNTSSWYDPNGVGHKTVYDPCPAGYRTMDNRIVNEVINNSQHWEWDRNRSDQEANWINPDSPFYDAEESVLAYKLPDGTYDFWPYAGHMHATSTSYSNATTSYTYSGIAFASNSINPESTNNATGIRNTYMSSDPNYQSGHNTATYYAGTIRCQKDDENR